MPEPAIPSATRSDPPAWSLPCFLLMGLLLRLPAVLLADGYEFVDQQYQYVDPAWHLATGQAWHRPWEWIDGLRSVVYPELLAAGFRAVAWLGVDDPMWTMRALRAGHAVVSLLPLWLFWLAVVEWRRILPSPTLRLALLVFAGAGIVVTNGVQPSGPALAATLALSAALAVHGPRWFPLLGGLCLGVAFCCRFQEALFGPPLLAVLLWQRRWPAALWFALGCVPGILLQGCSDLATHGTFLATAWNYVDSNVNLGAANKWKQQPWWFYLAAGVLPVLALVPPWWRVAWQRAATGVRLLPGLAVAGSFHIALHSCIARKAVRFEYGALAMWIAVAAVGLAARPSRPGERLARWHTGALLAVHLGMFCYVSLWFGHAGAVRAALALRGDPALAGELLVVDGDATSLGGFFYLRPPADRVVGVERAALRQRLQQAPPVAGAIVVAVRDPIADADVAGLGRLEPVGAFTGMFDLRTGERRFVYRWR